MKNSTKEPGQSRAVVDAMHDAACDAHSLIAAARRDCCEAPGMTLDGAGILVVTTLLAEAERRLAHGISAHDDGVLPRRKHLSLVPCRGDGCSA